MSLVVPISDEDGNYDDSNDDDGDGYGTGNGDEVADADVQVIGVRTVRMSI